jgi:hypothetical protein
MHLFTSRTFIQLSWGILEECYEKREEKKNENAKQLEDIVPANEN